MHILIPPAKTQFHTRSPSQDWVRTPAGFFWRIQPTVHLHVPDEHAHGTGPRTQTDKPTGFQPQPLPCLTANLALATPCSPCLHYRLSRMHPILTFTPSPLASFLFLFPAQGVTTALSSCGVPPAEQQGFSLEAWTRAGSLRLGELTGLCWTFISSLAAQWSTQVTDALAEAPKPSQYPIGLWQVVSWQRKLPVNRK